MRYLFSALALMLCGCSVQGNSGAGKTVFVSIEPLKWAISSMVDSTVTVETLVDGATSPETFEPSARQVAKLSESDVYFALNLFDFEKELFHRIAQSDVQTVDLCAGVQTIRGGCGGSCGHAHAHSHGAQSIDTHVWMSPKEMRIIVENGAKVLKDKGLLIEEKRDSILRVIDFLHTVIESKTTDVKSFAIVHPSLGYFARDYGLTQIAIEVDGKEPSPRSIAESLKKIKSENISTILYSGHDAPYIGEIISKESGVTLQKFEPLSSSWTDMVNSLIYSIYGAR